METLTLHSVEWSAIVRHLAAARDRLDPSDSERLLLDGLIIKIGAQHPEVTVGRLEVFCLLRYLRFQRSTVLEEQQSVEDRRRMGLDGTLDIIWRALDLDATILDDVIRRLWDLTR